MSKNHMVIISYACIGLAVLTFGLYAAGDIIDGNVTILTLSRALTISVFPLMSGILLYSRATKK